ncbi:hypothetical protein G5B39_12070 [Rhodobacteraceae bacterium SC52]|nr:hypothetical protein G5B39_12070 [Rhodobacteraceae bacterium SC52]
MREEIKDLALKESDLSPGELALRLTDTEKFFVSEASAYRILKSYDPITSPAYVVLSAADEVKDKTTRPNELWQTLSYLGLPSGPKTLTTNTQELQGGSKPTLWRLSPSERVMSNDAQTLREQNGI